MKIKKIILTTLLLTSAFSMNAAVNAKNYSRMDKDGDGKWSHQEYVQYRMGGFAKMDKNKDGMVDASEAWNANYLKAVDADKNGKISPEESKAYHVRIAVRVDKNSDGFISLEELNPKKG